MEDKAKAERLTTMYGFIDEAVRSEGLTPNEDVTEDIASNVADDIESLGRERGEEVLEHARRVFVTEQEVRELADVLDPKGSSDVKIGALEVVADQYRLKSSREADPVKETFYKASRGWLR